MKRPPSASSLDRASACPASCALRQAKSVSGHSARGDAVHAFILSTRRGAGNIEDVPEEYRTFCESINIDQVPEGRYEVALGLDVETGIGRMDEDELGDIGQNEIVGRCDILREVKVGEQRAVYIGDLKTGLGAHVPRARDCLQIGFYGLAAARAQGVDTAVTEIIRVTDSGFLERESAVFDGWALDSLELELKDLVRRVREAQAVVSGGGVPDQTTGPHCAYCPALAHCPAQMRLVQALAATPERFEKEIELSLTPETAKMAFQKYRQAQEVMARIRTALYSYAAQHPFQVGNGMVLGPVSVSKKKLDAEVVHGVVSEMFGPAVARSAVKLSTNKTALRAALRPVVAYGELMKAERIVLESTKLRGGVRHGESVQVKVHRSGDDVVEVDADE